MTPKALHRKVRSLRANALQCKVAPERQFFPVFPQESAHAGLEGPRLHLAGRSDPRKQPEEGHDRGPCDRDRRGPRRPGNGLRRLHGLLRPLQGRRSFRLATGRHHGQGPGSVRADPPRHLSLAVRLQRPRRFPAPVDLGIEAADRRSGGHRHGARLARADRGVLLGQHDQLRLHGAPERRGLSPSLDVWAWRSCSRPCTDSASYARNRP